MKYHLLAIFVVIVWGTTFVSTKAMLLHGLTPEDIYFLRFLIAYLCMIPFAGRRLFADNFRDEVLLFLLGFLGGTLYFLAENFALKLTYTSNVSLIVSINPLMTALFTGLFYKDERLSSRQFLFCLIVLLGLALVVFNGQFVLHLSPLGDLLAFSAAVCWGIYSLIMRRLKGAYSNAFITRKVFAYGLLTIIPVIIYQHDTSSFLAMFQKIQTDPILLYNLLYLAVVAAFICFYAWNVALLHVGIVRASNYLYSSCIFTLIAAHIFLNEHISALALLGTALILFGLWLVNRYRPEGTTNHIITSISQQ